jgi:hypothetical protein
MNKPVCRILFLSTWAQNSPLMQNYLLPNVDIIQKLISEESKVWVQTWETDAVPFSNKVDHPSITWLTFQYQKFGPMAVISYFFQFVRLIIFCRKNKITHLHGFAPVANSMGLLLSYFSRAKFIVDSWEPHAEPMVESGVWKKGGLPFRILFLLEKLTSKKADFLLAASTGMTDYAKKKWGIVPKNVLHRPACVKLTEFDPGLFNKVELRKALNLENKIICVCASQLGGLYLREKAIEFFKAGLDIYKDNFAVILLTRNNPVEMEELLHQFSFPLHQIIIKEVVPKEVVSYLAMSDYAFNPQCPVPSKRYGTPVKDGEYWAMGLPIILLPDISDDSDIVLEEKAGVILQNLSYAAMLNAHRETKILLAEKNLTGRIRSVAAQYRNYDIAEKAYQIIYAS